MFPPFRRGQCPPYTRTNFTIDNGRTSSALPSPSRSTSTFAAPIAWRYSFPYSAARAARSFVAIQRIIKRAQSQDRRRVDRDNRETSLECPGERDDMVYPDLRRHERQAGNGEAGAGKISCSTEQHLPRRRRVDKQLGLPM